MTIRRAFATALARLVPCTPRSGRGAGEQQTTKAVPHRGAGGEANKEMQ
ncbi:hypothetical protein [Streptomyces cinnamoneus]|nr:hypothetical protein [Streptomyces cinnamoneus]